MSDRTARGVRSRWRSARGWQKALAGAALLVVVTVAALGLHTYGRLQGWFTERLSPDELSALLSPSYVIVKPDGPGPFPTAMLYHGCDGMKDNVARWAEALREHGWASVSVDSNGPRDYEDYAAWRLVCAGQLLPGPERAGDILVSIADAIEMPFVDRDRMALVGMSHGGWSIMELMTLDLTRQRPTNLRRLPEPGAALLDGIRAEILVYPWCGLANHARFDRWRHDDPVLFLLAGEDIIAPTVECGWVADGLQKEGIAVETVMYEGATHGFDQMDRSEFSPLKFDPEATADALARALAFLDAAVAPPKE